MLSGGFVERDIASIRLPQWGRVVEAEGVVPWLVVDPDGNPVAPVHRFLRDFVARGNRAGSVRSYAYGLLRWWRWLEAVGVDWDKATSAEVRDFVLWLGQASKPRNSPRTASAARAGTVNAVTRRRYLGDQYEPRTVRHGNAVLRSFYEYWIERGGGPLVNPVALDRRGRRPNEHHNPLASFRPEGKIRYNPRVPRRAPRAMPDERRNELFAGLRSDRDRAILAPASCSACGAATWTGVSSSCGSAGRERGRTSGFRPARRRSCGSGCIWPGTIRWSRASPCGGRCAAVTMVTGCAASR